MHLVEWMFLFDVEITLSFASCIRSYNDQLTSFENKYIIYKHANYIDHSYSGRTNCLWIPAGVYKWQNISQVRVKWIVNSFKNVFWYFNYRLCSNGACNLETAQEDCSFECDSGYIMDVSPCLQMLHKMVGKLSFLSQYKITIIFVI